MRCSRSAYRGRLTKFKSNLRTIMLATAWNVSATKYKSQNSLLILFYYCSSIVQDIFVAKKATSVVSQIIP